LLAQRLLGEFSFRDVAQDNGEQSLFADLHLRDGRLDGKFFPGGAQPIDSAEFAHLPAGVLGLFKISNVGIVGATKLIHRRRC
jgi:hypothetical protein